MSYTQFSSLSSNSSNDLEMNNIKYQCINYYDQETLSITSDKSVSDLDDFDNNAKPYEFKVDPFLNDVMNVDVEDCADRESNLESYSESYDASIFISTECDLDYVSVTVDNLQTVSSELLDWDILSIHKNTSQKQSSSLINQEEVHYQSWPTKHRRVQVSYHETCDEWINNVTDKFSLRANGTIDRRKTKHHKVLNDGDMDPLLENYDFKRKKNSKYVTKIHPSVQNTIFNLSSSNPLISTSISLYSQKFQTIRSVKPFYTNYNNEIYKKSKMKEQKEQKDILITDIYHKSDVIKNEISKNQSKIEESSEMPSMLKMGKRVYRKGHRLSLWQFLMYLLDSNKYQEHCTGIKWINRTNGIFHIVDSKQVATLWGVYKERKERMTYDSLARSLRHYYKKNLMAKINNRRLVYQIAQECIQWSSETFIKRSRE